MSATYKINGAQFADMVKSGAVNLRKNAKIVNELNVFPIPDGDTGENMSRTIEGGAAALDAAKEQTISKAAEIAARGMLLAARGNSGVILSQFFEGLRKGLIGLNEIGVAELKTAFAYGVRQSYAAVVRPTEGTILTVMREACEKAKSVADDAPLERYCSIFTDEVYASLERTPDLLPVLKESGVIDSGGAGFAYIAEGMKSALSGETALHGFEESAAVDAEAAADDSKFGADSKMDYGYCTELIVQLMNSKVNAEEFDVNELIKHLENMGGDSIVAFKTGTRIKLHVHTFEPDRVMEYCRGIGEFVAVKVENMSIQHTGAVVRNRFVRPTAAAKRKKYACVAVADGKGLIEQFLSLGVDRVVDGKQTMNPSTQDFITAFDAVNADVIFVLPNNSNVILAAKQAAELYKSSRVIVVDCSTLAEGYSAASMLDYTPDDADEIAKALRTAAEGVTTGLVSYAVRNCEMNGRKIKKGDFLGIVGKTLMSASDDIVKAATELLDGIDKKDKSVMIAICGGEYADGKAVAAIEEHLKKTAPDMEFYSFRGDQDVYSFIFVVE